MKRFFIGLLSGIILSVVILFLYSRVQYLYVYKIHPGFTTLEYREKFYNEKPKCLGIRFTVRDTIFLVPDSPIQGICIGKLINKKLK